MSDQNTNAGPGQDQGSADDMSPAKLYPTRAECEAAKPADATKNYRVFEVLLNGTSKGWLWARGYDNALARAARADGYTVSIGKATAPITEEAVAVELATFTDDELAAMGLARKPTGKGRKN